MNVPFNLCTILKFKKLLAQFLEVFSWLAAIFKQDLRLHVVYDSGSWSKVPFDLMETSLWLKDKAISITEQRAQVLNPFRDWLHFFLLLTRDKCMANISLYDL